MWEAERPEVLDYTDDMLRDLWISPVTGEEMNRCPWLRKLPMKEKYKCRIHKVRPEICRGYPVDIEQMANDCCEMLEDGDITKSREELILELQKLRNAV
jgi:Fe-S-cluster containining protein